MTFNVLVRPDAAPDSFTVYVNEDVVGSIWKQRPCRKCSAVWAMETLTGRGIGHESTIERAAVSVARAAFTIKERADNITVKVDF